MSTPTEPDDGKAAADAKAKVDAALVSANDERFAAAIRAAAQLARERTVDDATVIAATKRLAIVQVVSLALIAGLPLMITAWRAEARAIVQDKKLDAIHDAANGAMGYQLKIYAEALREKADKSGEQADIEKATEAERAHLDHVSTGHKARRGK